MLSIETLMESAKGVVKEELDFENSFINTNGTFLHFRSVGILMQGKKFFCSWEGLHK